MENRFEKNVTGSFQICTHGCNRCGIVKSFTCYFTIPKSLKNEKKLSSNITLISCVFRGLIFSGVFGIILWFVFTKRTNIYNSDKEKIQPRVASKSLMQVSVQTVENSNEDRDPIYEDLQEFHRYA